MKKVNENVQNSVEEIAENACFTYQWYRGPGCGSDCINSWSLGKPYIFLCSHDVPIDTRQGDYTLHNNLS